MKFNFYPAIFCGTIALALSASGVLAQNPSPQLAPTQTKQQSHLKVLEEQLKPIILEKYPDAKIEFLGDTLVIRYRSTQFDNHLFTPFADTFPAYKDQFPSEFPEFIILINVRGKETFYRIDFKSDGSPTPFGTVESKIYSVKEMRKYDGRPEFEDVPFTSWAFSALYRLTTAGLIENMVPSGTRNRPVTRYEFTVMVAKTLDNEKMLEKLAAAPENLKEDFANLRMEFPIEPFFSSQIRTGVSPLTGRKRLAGNQYLWFVFAYGHGADVALVGRVKQTVDDYAKANFVEDAVAEETPEIAPPPIQ